jgi:hypothetical protein
VHDGRFVVGMPLDDGGNRVVDGNGKARVFASSSRRTANTVPAGRVRGNVLGVIQSVLSLVGTRPGNLLTRRGTKKGRADSAGQTGPSPTEFRHAGPTRIALLFSYHYHQPRRAVQGVSAASLPGCPTTTAELSALGFSSLTLRIRDGQVPLQGGAGMNWDTVGEVPKAPGTYLFTVANVDAIHVTYVGITTHLWMVTKGRLPSGASRPGQRYGRPKYAGITRQRVNVLVTAELRRGHTVLHWIRALPDAPVGPTELTDVLKRDEEALIQRWHLRQCGWNRG